MKIELTRFELPFGKKSTVEYEIYDSFYEKYKAIIDNGCRLTIEKLRTGQVSICIEHDYGDFDIQLCRDGDEVATIQTLLQKFDVDSLNNWRHAFDYED